MTDSERIAVMNSEKLLELVRRDTLDELQALKILRNPYCTVEVAEELMEKRQLLSAFRVRELICRVRGMPLYRVTNLISGLPWLSLLSLAQQPATPPQVRRRAKEKLLARIPLLTDGERIALARRAHRDLFSALLSTGELMVIEALLDNPRMTESDLMQLLTDSRTPGSFITSVGRHRKWSVRRELRRIIALHPSTPLPLAVSALADMGLHELRDIVCDPRCPEKIRSSALDLARKRRRENRT